MSLAAIDWLIIVLFFVVSVGIGMVASRTSGRSFSEYFLAGGKMSWWLLGLSMVATSFAADTPNFVANVVRTKGVSGNWVWWSLLLTGLLTTFVYARLWKRSGVQTDLEFYEVRYGGQVASALRIFRSVYLGVIFNCLIMATVTNAAIKISGVLLGIDPYTTVLVAGTVTVLYTLLGGLKGVIWTDCFQFIMAMIGAVAAAWYVCGLPEVGGVATLIEHPDVSPKLGLLPNWSDVDAIVTLLVIPLTVQWWSSWYPGAEPGGGGYVAQRMLGAKSEKDATTATLLFVITHYAIRPWPWIVVALASIVIFPDIESLQGAFPNIDPKFVKDDIAYPAMLTRLPAGLLGLVIASLIAAFMSTISTHLNWGSSYIANDLYKRFSKKPEGEALNRELVLVGRITTALLMILAVTLSLQLESALDSFNIILQIGAGTGLLYILRWFWWRINALSEITAMFVSFGVALIFEFVIKRIVAEDGIASFLLIDGVQMCIGVAITSIAWISVALLTAPEDDEVLIDFYRKIRPPKFGWKPIHEQLSKRGEVIESDGSLPAALFAIIASAILVYGLLFGAGYLLYGQYTAASIALASATVAAVVLAVIWKKLSME